MGQKWYEIVSISLNYNNLLYIPYIYKLHHGIYDDKLFDE